MELDTFEYPPNEDLIQIHVKANRIGKLRDRFNPDPITSIGIYSEPSKTVSCMHCGRVASECPKFKFFQSDDEIQQRFGIYGPNCVIYLGIIKKTAIFMVIISIIFALPLLLMNIYGYYCQKINACKSDSLIYRWSLYNVLGIWAGSLPHTCLWFIFCILMIFFTTYLRKYSMQTYRKINARNTTDSDYCLLLRRLPISTQQQQIKSLIKQVSRQNRQHDTWHRKNKFQIKDVIMINKANYLRKLNQKSVRQFKKSIRRKQIHNFVSTSFNRQKYFAGAALVRFYSKYVNDIICQSLETSMCQKICNYFCVFYSQKTNKMIKNHKISIESAPHPTDMQWKSFGYSQKNRILRKIILNILAFIILFISSAITLIISAYIQKSTNNTSGNYSFLLTVIIVKITLIFNLIIRKIIIFLTKLMRLDTVTDEQTQQISLIVIHQSLNLGFFSIITPIIVKFPNFLQDQIKKSSSFPLVMLISILSQAIGANLISFLIDYFQIKQKIRRILHNKKIQIRTQTEAFQKFKGVEVPFVRGYAFVVKLVWFGSIYGVLTPISIPIATIGLILYYFFERILYNRTYSIPIYTGPRINYEMIDMLEWTPFLIGLFNLFLYKSSQFQRKFQSDIRIQGLIIAMMVIGGIHLFFPWKKILKRRIKTFQKLQKNIAYNPEILQITFQESNPQSRHTPNIFYKQGRIPDIRQSFQSSPVTNQRFIYSNQ